MAVGVTIGTFSPSSVSQIPNWTVGRSLCWQTGWHRVRERNWLHTQLSINHKLFSARISVRLGRRHCFPGLYTLEMASRVAAGGLSAPLSLRSPAERNRGEKGTVVLCPLGTSPSQAQGGEMEFGTSPAWRSAWETRNKQVWVCPVVISATVSLPRFNNSRLPERLAALGACFLALTKRLLQSPEKCGHELANYSISSSCHRRARSQQLCASSDDG